MILGDALCSRLLLLLDGIEGSDKLFDVTPFLDATELLLRLDDRGTDPAHDHPAALPTLHVPRVRCDPTVQVLDRIRAAKLPVERSADAQPLKRERLIESLKDRRSRSGMVGLEGGGQAFESPLRHLGLIETARANRIEPWAYLLHVFDALPWATSTDQVEALLPQNVDPALIRHPASTTSFVERLRLMGPAWSNSTLHSWPHPAIAKLGNPGKVSLAMLCGSSGASEVRPSAPNHSVDR